MQEFTYISAFAAGLMGGVHCIGMCGGIVGALSFGLRRRNEPTMSSLFTLLLAYNAGRLFSYTLAGAMLGGLGWVLSNWLEIRQLQIALQLFAGVFLVLLGLYLGGWWLLLARVEKIGGGLWKRIEPLGRKLLPVTHVGQALSLGLLWGWLPCGLVYSVLIASISAGGFIEGGLLMLCFGLGTLPNLLAMGLFAERLARWINDTRVRQTSGAVVIGFGLWSLYLVYAG